MLLGSHCRDKRAFLIGAHNVCSVVYGHFAVAADAFDSVINIVLTDYVADAVYDVKALCVSEVKSLFYKRIEVVVPGIYIVHIKNLLLIGTRFYAKSAFLSMKYTSDLRVSMPTVLSFTSVAEFTGANPVPSASRDISEPILG